jgi:hypothetical protein
MFQVEQAQPLQQVEWIADDGHGIVYVEAWQCPNRQTYTAQNFRHGILHDSEVDLWLEQKGK